MRLEGQHILITGAARRIGREIALHLAAQGANIALHYDKSLDAAEETQKEIQALGADCQLYQSDLSKIGKVADLIEKVESHEALTTLINNAAIFGKGEMLDTDLENWQKHLDINLSAPFLLSQSLYRSVMNKDRSARIVNMLDWRAIRPGKDHFAYTISKSGLAALTRSLALSMAPNISVNGIALGAILPPRDGSETPGITEAIPMKRWGKLEEVCQTIEFLISGPSYITGEIIHLDGGRHLN